MKRETLIKLANNKKWKITYKKYRYWDNVLYFNNTAICFDIIDENIEIILRKIEYFLKFVTQEYIRNAVENNVQSLGVINYKNKNKFGGKIYFKFNEEVI